MALLDDDGVVTQSVTDPVDPGRGTLRWWPRLTGAGGRDIPTRMRRRGCGASVKGMTGEDGGYTAEECREAATRHGVLSHMEALVRRDCAPRGAHARPCRKQQQVITLPAVSVSAGADVTEGGGRGVSR